MSLFSRSRSSSQPLVRRISTTLRRRLSGTMPGQRSTKPGNDTSSSSTTHFQVEPAPDATPLKASSTSNPGDVSPESIDRESHPHAVELHDNPINVISLPPESRSPSPPSPTQPSPAFTFAVLDSPPTPPSPQTIYTTYTCIPVEERLQRRQECLFHLERFRQGLVQDPFGEWTDLANDLYDGNIPPEFYLASAPFTLHSLRGRIRLRYIRTAFCMPIDSNIYQIESFLSRNSSIVRYLHFNTVPDPDRAYMYQIHVHSPETRKYNRRVLRAIKELDWMDGEVDKVANSARVEDKKALSRMYKVREVEILPTVWNRMEEMKGMDEKWKDVPMEELHGRVVERFRRNRPNSLLRNVVTYQDVRRSHCRFM
ncbi:uncharacterized protein Triagg1_322 [Trichoderma aggressivum f. europaeum]|uniref:Uncharacterized protein n=1 Tax=Trichoderma aggressivum f. europaeum TaxID=173218 RepID=A0AAE1IK55_9HYPO|nr:hypothetical protein Triagg1_322 [Trichoderma aggressivum f. europaeum]